MTGGTTAAAEFAAGIGELAMQAREAPEVCCEKWETIAEILRDCGVAITAGEVLSLVLELAGPPETGRETLAWSLRVDQMARRDLRHACGEVARRIQGPDPGGSVSTVPGQVLERAFARARADRMRTLICAGEERG